MPIFIEGDGLLADALVNRTMEQHGLDAERAFAHTLPVGTTTPTIEYLRKARLFLLRADLAWPSFVRRMHDTPEYPADAWCARLRELQAMAETIRRGI